DQRALRLCPAEVRHVQCQRLTTRTVVVGQQIAGRPGRSPRGCRAKALARGCVVGAEVLGNGHGTSPPPDGLAVASCHRYPARTMLRQVSSDKPKEGSSPTPPAAGSGADTPLPRSAWWVQLLSRLPFPALYRLADLLGWLAFRVFPHREDVVRANLSQCFPEVDEAGMRDIRRRYYAGFADVLIEVIKSATISPEEIRRRVRIVGLEQPQALLEQGRSVLLAAAHQCNWEWMLLALSLVLGFPLDAAYKPLVDSWAEREMKKVRSRFGSRLVPAKELLADIIKRGKVVRAVAMVADQEPTTSEHKHWTRFLNRD